MVEKDKLLNTQENPEADDGRRDKKRKKDAMKVAELFEEKTSDMVRTGLYLRKDLHDKLKAASAETDKSMNSILNKIVAKFFED